MSRTNNINLKEIIEELEAEQALKASELKEQFKKTYPGFKILSLFKSSSTTSDSSNILDNIKGTSIGLLTGYFTKVLLVGKSGSYFKKFAGLFIQYIVTFLVAQNIVVIKKLGRLFFRKVLSRKHADSIS